MKFMCGFLLAVLLLCGFAGTQAHAVEFKCVEASKYRNLYRIFDHDPVGFSDHLYLTAGYRPPPDACRAMVVTGRLEEGDTKKLLEELIRSRGWLGVLYLAHAGDAGLEEVKFATALRAFWLKTRIVTTQTPAIYSPDFVSYVRLPAPSATNAWPAVWPPNAFPINRGLNDFARGLDVKLPVEPKQSPCKESCVSAYVSGAYRTFVGALPDYPLVESKDTDLARTRISMMRFHDTGKFSPLTEPGLPAPINTMTAVPGGLMTAIHARCINDIDAGFAMQTQIKALVDDMAKRDFDRYLRIDNVMGRFESLRNVAARFERCVNGVYERERLATWEKVCGSECDVAKLEPFAEKNMLDFLQAASSKR